MSATKSQRNKGFRRKILFLGAGEAALGCSNLLVQAMIAEGLTEQQAKRQNLPL